MSTTETKTPYLGLRRRNKIQCCCTCFRSLQTIMQNYYIRIEDMPSLVSHKLSIIKYVVLKKIFFFLCFDRLIWTWTWTWTRTSLDSDLFGLGLDSDSNLFGLGLVLDSTKVDLTTALVCARVCVHVWVCLFL